MLTQINCRLAKQIAPKLIASDENIKTRAERKAFYFSEYNRLCDEIGVPEGKVIQRYVVNRCNESDTYKSIVALVKFALCHGWVPRPYNSTVKNQFNPPPGMAGWKPTDQPGSPIILASGI